MCVHVIPVSLKLRRQTVINTVSQTEQIILDLYDISGS